MDTKRDVEHPSGGQLVVEQLRREGVDTVFCVPGESYLEVLDALHDAPLRVVVCRQEGGAGYMADAHARITGQVGVCMVSRGPGAANAMIAMHTAWQDSVPLVLFVGLIPRADTYRESFQEFDLNAWFGSTAKAVFRVEDAARVPELVARAFYLARSGRPGPVVVGLPEDMLRDRVDVQGVESIRVLASEPPASALNALAQSLARASRPLVILGGGGWTPTASAQVRAWAERWALPVAADFNYLDLIDHRSSSFIGTAGYGRTAEVTRAIREADWVLGIGSPLGDVVTDSWSLLPVYARGVSMATVLPDTDGLGSAHPATLRINATPASFAQALDTHPALAGPASSSGPLPWQESTRALRHARVAPDKLKRLAGDVDLNAIFSHLAEALPTDAIVSWGAGNHGAWGLRFLRFNGYPSQLSPRNGAMGYGIPAAVAASLAHPDRRVVSVAGDGCFMMNGQELAVAVANGAKPVVILLNNSMYGTIRTHQELHHPNRVCGTQLVNPNFAEYAKAFGGYGARVERNSEFADALAGAFAANTFAIVEIIVPQTAILPGTELADLHGMDSM